MIRKLTAAAVLAVGLSGAANAAPLFLGNVDSDEYITYGGLNWAWGSPCAGEAPSCAEGVTLHDGWRIPTIAEFNARPDVSAFLIGDEGIACASGWFQGNYAHCDIGDALNGYLWHPSIAYSPYKYLYETWLVQDEEILSFSIATLVPVPEPATLAVLGMGFLGLGLARRRKTAKA